MNPSRANVILGGKPHQQWVLAVGTVTKKVRIFRNDEFNGSKPYFENIRAICQKDAENGDAEAIAALLLVEM